MSGITQHYWDGQRQSRTPGKIYYLPTYFDRKKEEQDFAELRAKAELTPPAAVPWYQVYNPLYGIFDDAELPPIKLKWYAELVRVAITTVMIFGVMYAVMAIAYWAGKAVTA